MGLLFSVSSLGSYLLLIGFAFFLLLVGRTIAVYLHGPLMGLLGHPKARLPRTWYGVISVSGIRGAIPIVLARGLLDTPAALGPSITDAVVAGVLGVAFVSIIVGNVSADVYVKRHFGAKSSDEPGDDRSLPAAIDR